MAKTTNRNRLIDYAAFKTARINRLAYSKLKGTWLYSWYIVRSFKRKTETRRQTSAPLFSEQVLYEEAKDRLALSSNLTHPKTYFQSKLHQRRFLQNLGSQLPTLHYQGPQEGLSRLQDGQYFVKPTCGTNAKGAFVFKKHGNRTDIEEIAEISGVQSHHINGSNSLITNYMAEDLLFDRYFSSLVDYKAYCFFPGHVDHILCIQRTPRKMGASFLPSGEPIETGKLKDRTMRHPPSEAIRQVAREAKRISARIPLSFVRLDFYVTTAGVIAGEITPIPGNAKTFSSEYDRQLGEKWWVARRALRRATESLDYLTEFTQRNIMFY